MKKIQLGNPQPTTIPNLYRIDMPSSVGTGSIEFLLFTSGLQFIVSEFQFKQQALIQSFSSEATVGFGFCLAGRFESKPACLKTAIAIKAGESGFFSFPKSIEGFEKVNPKKLQRMYLVLKGDSLSDMAKGDEDRFYPVLKSLEKKVPIRTCHAMTPVMKAILYQMRHCPYYGMTRQIFIEGKAMELLAHKLEQLYPGGNSHSISINASEAERVRHAAYILVHNMENPPDIMTLAQSVGLNRTKLYRCFRRIFNLSPFEFLRNQRLHAAMELLQNGDLNVTEAALMVGYSNLSYFAKAFKSMFGITPRQLRKSYQPSEPD